MKQIITSLDIGSDKIKLVVSEMHNNNFFVLACSEVNSKGIKKGFVVDPEAAVESVKECFKRVNEVLSIKIDNVILIVPSNESEFIKSDGYTTINREEDIVSGDDIVRALQACVYNKVSSNKELVNIMPLNYVLDEDTVVTDPKGEHANKLTVNSVLGVVPKKNVYGIFSLLNTMGIKVTDVCFGGIADYYEFRRKSMIDSEVAVINIGKDKTEISILSKNVLVGNDVLNIGGRNIDRDISYVYDLSLKESVKLKEKFALAHKKHASTSETYECLTKNNETIKINQYEISEIVYERMREILELSKKQINILTKKEISYIIITGGSTEIDDFNEVVDEVIGKKAVLGNITELGVRNNKFSSALGITKYYAEKINFRNRIASTISEQEQEEMFQVKKKYGNILGKVYGYFFDN